MRTEGTALKQGIERETDKKKNSGAIVKTKIITEIESSHGRQRTEHKEEISELVLPNWNTKELKAGGEPSQHTKL